ncbi:MAG: phosphatase [Verrucomicrobia bacterium]|nr:phosphatase [Verrucomicrobiota bacterium]
MMNRPQGPIAAALDIGSNTIKMLVVEKTPDGLKKLAENTSETRISQGISQEHPELTEASMSRALEVIGDLYREMRSFHPVFTRIVATSAVRDAANRSVFVGRVLEETGQHMDVISGEEEAQLIGKGVLTDPALVDQNEVMIFDMGGGSVECIHLKNRTIEMAKSLPLGGVRLMEKHVADPSQPLTQNEKKRVIETVLEKVQELSLDIENPEKALAVGAGGTWVTSRAILAHRQGKTLSESSPYLTIEDMRSIFEEASNYSLDRRLQIPKLPPNRADVFPVTLLALITLSEWAGISQFYHCFHSLRYGVAYELLRTT